MFALLEFPHFSHKARNIVIARSEATWQSRINHEITVVLDCFAAARNDKNPTFHIFIKSMHFYVDNSCYADGYGVVAIAFWLFGGTQVALLLTKTNICAIIISMAGRPST